LNDRIRITRRFSDYITSTVMPQKFILRGIKIIRRIADIEVILDDSLVALGEFAIEINESQRDYAAICNFLHASCNRMEIDLQDGSYVPGDKWGRYLREGNLNRFGRNGRLSR